MVVIFKNDFKLKCDLGKFEVSSLGQQIDFFDLLVDSLSNKSLGFSSFNLSLESLQFSLDV